MTDILHYATISPCHPPKTSLPSSKPPPTATAVMQTPSPPPFGPVIEPGRTLMPTDMTDPNPLIPADIYRNGSVSHADLATFAWLEFFSAVAPDAAPALDRRLAAVDAAAVALLAVVVHAAAVVECPAAAAIPAEDAIP